MKSLAAVALVLFLSPLTAGAVDWVRLETEVDGFVRTYQPAPDTGIALGVIKDGELVYFKGYGHRDRESALPVTADTRFMIGSNTKSFTALAAALTAYRNGFTLETPVRERLPGFALRDPAATERATLIDLLSHRTGLPRHDLLWYLTPLDRNELFARIPFLAVHPRAEYGFRGRWQYNNFMYLVAGILVERETGSSWEEFVRREVLVPLGMSSTTMSFTEIGQAPELALGYAGTVRLPFKDLTNVAPAGSMNSSVRDLAKWLDFHARGGVAPDGRRLLPADWMARFHEAHSRDPGEGAGIPVEYGLGWFLTNISGKKVIWHGGNIDGFSTHMSFEPESGWGLVILVNQNGASPFEFPYVFPAAPERSELKALPLRLYEELLGPGLETQVATAIRATLIATPFFSGKSPGQSLGTHRWFQLAPLKVSEWDGIYRDRGYGEIQVESRADGLWVRYFHHEWRLEPTESSRDRFLLRAGAGFELAVEFEREDGRPVRLRIPFEPAVAPIPFERRNSPLLD